jgi:hydroxymethylbilane synthase
VSREIWFGSRESALAIAQTRLVMDAIAESHPELSLRLVTMKTGGDLHPKMPLEGNGSPGKALFTDALEQALLNGTVDFCVHSLKDMEMEIPENLPIVGMAARGDPRDLLILPRGTAPGFRAFDGAGRALDLPLPVGCSSLRRRTLLLSLVPALQVSAVRGNVLTRLAKMDSGEYGALVLAAAGIDRLGISDRGGYVFSVREMIPAPGQGILAIQGRRGENPEFLETIRDPTAEEAARAERALIRALNGGCASPTAAYAHISGNEITILGMYAPDPASPPVRDELSGERGEGPRLAEILARRLLEKGRSR